MIAGLPLDPPYRHFSKSLHCSWDRCAGARQLAFHLQYQHSFTSVRTRLGAWLESHRQSLESSQFGRLRGLSGAGLVLLYFVAVSVFPRVGVFFGMDSHDAPLGLVRELGNRVFSLASSESCLGNDGSAVSWPRWIFLVRPGCHDLERILGLRESDGSTKHRVWHP